MPRTRNHRQWGPVLTNIEHDRTAELTIGDNIDGKMDDAEIGSIVVPWKFMLSQEHGRPNEQSAARAILETERSAHSHGG
jgi:hypothetical protein